MLHPSFKGDFFPNDESFERAKQLIREKIMSVSEEINHFTPGRRVRSEHHDELSLYISEKTMAIDSTFEDVVQYWERNKDRFPEMYKLTRKYFSYLCTSCSSERLFSNASGFVTEKRTRLLPSHLEEYCILYSHIVRDGTDLFKGITFN